MNTQTGYIPNKM